MTDAYEEAYVAFDDGLDREDNPHAGGSRAAAQWDAGWLASAADEVGA